MSRVKFFLVMGLAFSSVCFGATLMQWTVSRPAIELNDVSLAQAEPSCQALVKRHRDQIAKKVAKEIYQEALTLSFNGQWQEAREASECAAWLEHGSKTWDFEAKDLIN